MTRNATVADGVIGTFKAGAKASKKKMEEEVDMANQEAIEKSDK